MKIDEALKRLSKTTLVGEEYDTARIALSKWQELREIFRDVLNDHRDAHTFLPIQGCLDVIDKCIEDIENGEQE